MLLSLLTLLTAGSVGGGDIRPILREQGFGAPLQGREQISYAGRIHQGRNNFRIYVYSGIHRAAAVDHGVNRIVVILNHSTYLGSYAIPWPTDCKVRDQSVVCDTEERGIIEFTRRGPTVEVWFDGEVSRFEFGDWFKNRSRKSD